MSDCSFSRKAPRAIIPSKFVDSACMYNLYSIEYLKLQPFETSIAKIGICLLPKNNSALLVLGAIPAHGRGNVWIEQAYICSGVEIEIKITNGSDTAIEIKPYSPIALAIIIKTSSGPPELVEKLDDTLRGVQGFGSSGLF